MRIAGIHVVDSPLVRAATDLAQSTSPAVLFNHVMRSWLFSVLISERFEISADPELLAVSCILHDLGLVPQFEGSARFEVDGANAAREFLNGYGIKQSDVQLVWDSIALHTTPSIALHKESMVMLCHSGIFTDVLGSRLQELERSQIDAVHAAFPRLHLKEAIKTTFCGLIERKRDSTYDSFVADIGRRYVAGYEPPNFSDALLNSPYSE